MARKSSITDSQKAEMRALSQEGISVADIAEEIGFSRGTVYKILKEGHVTPKRQGTILDVVDIETLAKQYEEWLPVRDIAETHNITLSQVYYVLRKAGIKPRSKAPGVLTDKEERMEVAVRMYQDGFYLHEIKTETKIAQPPLHEELRRRKIPFRRPRATMTHKDMVEQVRKRMEQVREDGSD